MCSDVVRPALLEVFLDALLVSTLSVAIAEIGDKTQLLALVLACRYRRFWPLFWGILIATLANHGLAGLAGQWLAGVFSPETLKLLVALSFIGVGLWTLIPDKVDEESDNKKQLGPFLATLVTFFLAEIGDKTQVATVILAARYDALLMVVAGSTLGMMLANIPAVWVGCRAGDRFKLQWVRFVAAALFIGLGIFSLFG